jgi:hypothetical protein
MQFKFFNKANIQGVLQVLHNGEDVLGGGGSRLLRHNDRLCIGANYCFVVVNPKEASTASASATNVHGWAEVDWDMINREIARAQVICNFVLLLIL